MATTTSNTSNTSNSATTGQFSHVLILSIDGLHESDLSVANLQSSLTNIKQLQGEGVTYTNAFTSAPSDSFPGELNYITGADPGTTGVFYDKSYSRTLYAPGTTLAQIQAGTAKPGTGVEFAENVDKSWANNGGVGNGTLNGGQGFDTTQLPVDSNGNPVYPNEYLKVNTIFDVATQAGLTTAWSDKHPAAYTILAGNDQLPVNNSVKAQLDPTKYNFATGQVGSITDYSSLEINASVAIDPTKPGPLSTSIGTLVDQSTNTPYSNTNSTIQNGVTINGKQTSFFNDATKGNPALYNYYKANPSALPAGFTLNDFTSVSTTSTYDDLKVKQILNEIDGMNDAGTKSQSTPAIFGMNFQAVSVGEKEPGTLFNGGGIDSSGNARPDLVTAVNHTDQSIGLILNELQKQGLASSTLVILTSKHGQNPAQDPTVGLQSTFDSVTGAAGGDGNLTAIGALLVRNGIQLASENGGDTSSLIFLKNQSDLQKALALLSAKNYSFDTAKDLTSDPTGNTLFATEDAAAQGTVLSGQGIINAGLGNPLTNDRTPDIVVELNTGYFFGNANKKRAEHGGFTNDDTHVALVAGSTGLSKSLQGVTDSQTVSTTQIAPTTLQVLGLDPNKLQGVQIDGTKSLPGLINTPQLSPVGTTGDDNLFASPGSKFDGQSNIVFTGAGNDTVDLTTVAAIPFTGNNIIDAGSGDDTIIVNKNDSVFGSDGNDTLIGKDSKGGNRMSGGAGDDTFFLGNNDRALGGDGNDKFYVGLGGGNLIAGGFGADQFWIVNGEIPRAANTIVDFQVGIDVLGIAGRGAGFGFSNLTLNGNDILIGGTTIATLSGISTNTLTAANFTFLSASVPIGA